MSKNIGKIIGTSAVWIGAYGVHQMLGITEAYYFAAFVTVGLFFV